jgi:hypothetical protein
MQNPLIVPVKLLRGHKTTENLGKVYILRIHDQYSRLNIQLVFQRYLGLCVSSIPALDIHMRSGLDCETLHLMHEISFLCAETNEAASRPGLKQEIKVCM